MIYLLDADVLIDANRDYYPMAAVRPFWGWLLYMGRQGHIKIIRDVLDEIKKGTDELAEWAKSDDVQDALLLDEEAVPEVVSHVTNIGYSDDLSDIELGKIGRDAFLIACAFTDKENRVVVTTEVSKPTASRQNRHIPDVCTTFGIRSCTPFALYKELGFCTDWEEKIAA